MDALKSPWPEVDAIIGNPPFLGGGQLRATLGDEYVEWLKRSFNIGLRDLCTYWFRRAEDQLAPGQRAGFVGTNSISQNMGREASLDYIVERGGVITDAVSSQKWPGDAKVHVSIVNWVNRPIEEPAEFQLDGSSVRGIRTDLKEQTGSSWRPVSLEANRGRCFEGPSPKAKGLLVSPHVAQRLLHEDPRASDVVRRYLTASDLTDSPSQEPSRWAIDFGLRTLEQAMKFSEPLAIVRKYVKPEREKNNRKSYRDLWWLFAEPRRAMRAALVGKTKFVAIAGHSKRVTIAWVEPDILASNATNIFAFDDDYSMGILLSRAHDAWAWAQSSTLETRLRYTPTSVFETFPWPDPDEPGRASIATAAANLYTHRSALCVEHNIGLTKLYNLMDDGAFTELRDLHRKLDVAVAAAYGWPASIAQDGQELVRRLTELNREITEGERSYHPFATAEPTL